MNPIAEKRDALKKAENLLGKTDDELLRYAALELRRCLEAVVYEKLAAYRTRLPAEIARTWQPPQAFKALAQLEPGAQHSATISVAPESEPGVRSGSFRLLGRDLRPDPAWLTKTWNKLGSYLHASSPFARHGRSDDTEARSFLEKVAQELHSFVDRSFTSTLAAVASFDCAECGNTIVANAEGARERGLVTCLNPQCEARYRAVADGDELFFHLCTSSTTCPECKAEITLGESHMKIGYEFSCPSCQVKYRFVHQSWQFERAQPTPTLSDSAGDT